MKVKVICISDIKNIEYHTGRYQQLIIGKVYEMESFQYYLKYYNIDGYWELSSNFITLEEHRNNKIDML
jgi:hypothetical protein